MYSTRHQPITPAPAASRRGRIQWIRWFVALAGLGLVFAGESARARQPDRPPIGGPATPEEIAVTNVMYQADELGQTNEFEATNELGATNDLARPDTAPARTDNLGQNSTRPAGDSRSPGNVRSGNDDRSQNGDRQSRRRSRDRGNGSRYSDNPSRSTTDSGPPVYASNGRLAYSNFQMISDRNIFDPNRVPGVHPDDTPHKAGPRIDSFALVGVMSYEKGTFAFFNGTSSDYQKALKLEDSIAGYTVSAIEPNAVKLATGTNVVELQIGTQLRREDGGAWKASDVSEAYASTSSAPSTTSSTPAGAAASDASAPGGSSADEVLKRLMQRREQE